MPTDRRARLAGIVGLIGAISLIAARPTHAQDYADFVWQQLQNQYDVVAGQGSYKLRSYIMGALNEDATESWTFPLNASTDYIVTGACDVDCSDIDIVVMDPNGNEVNADRLADDQPIVEFATKGTGKYTVQIEMYSCSVEPCYFGFGIFHR